MIFITRNRTFSIMKSLTFKTFRINSFVRFESKTATSTSNSDYEMIYKFPLIRLASLVNRLKLYQTVVTGVSLPVIGILTASDIITTNTAFLFAMSGITWCVTLLIVGFLGHNRVGFVYLKNDQKTVKFSYADFWGRRVNIDVDINDIWRLNDLPTFNPLYYNLQRYSTNDTLKFNLKYGKIIDPEKFRLVFGDYS